MAAIASTLDRRVHITTTLQWPGDAQAVAIMEELVRRADPILAAQQWRVLEMKEFFPKDARLLGLNVNKGQEVCIRFRRPDNRLAFFELEAIVATMIHELCHCRIGPHNKHFWALFRQLIAEEEHRDLCRAAQQSDAHAGARCSSAAAAPSGRVLGGAQPTVSRSVRDVVAEATLRRLAIAASTTTTSFEKLPEGRLSQGRSSTLRDFSDDAFRGCSQVLTHRRPRSDDADLPSQDQTSRWQCDRCGFENHCLLPYCEVCSDDLSGATVEVDADDNTETREYVVIDDD